MNTLDTATVLEIIKMINGRLFNLQIELDQKYISEQSYYRSRHELLLFEDHLQSFIEGQLNAAENQSTEQ